MRQSASKDRARGAGAGRLALVAAVSLGLFVGGATAQPNLPRANQQQYSDAERERFAEYAEWLTEQIGTGERADAEAARENIARALGRNATVRFRLELAQQMLTSDAAFRELCTHEDAWRAVNALMIAGLIADRRSVPALGEGLGDEREAVRIGAAAAARAMMVRSTGEDRTAREQAGALRSELTEALRTEPSAAAARSMIGAMLATPEQGELFDAGLAAAARALSERIETLREDHAGTLIEDGVVSQTRPADWVGAQTLVVQSAVQRMLNAGRGAELDRAMLVASAKNAALLIANLRDAAAELEAADRAARRAGEEETDRAQRFARRVRPLVSIAENHLLEVQSSLLGAGLVPPRSVYPAWQQYADRNARLDDVREAFDENWVGDGGALTDPPFGFDAETFQEPDTD